MAFPHDRCRSWYLTRYHDQIKLQAKYPRGVGVEYLRLVGVADRRVLDPLDGFLRGLEWPIRGEQHAVDPDLLDRHHQLRPVVHAARRHYEVVREVLARGPFPLGPAVTGVAIVQA